MSEAHKIITLEAELLVVSKKEEDDYIEIIDEGVDRVRVTKNEAEELIEILKHYVLKGDLS